MNTRIICGSAHGAWDEYGAHCSVCHPPDPRDAEIAALRARAEKAEAERDAAIEGKAEVFFAVEDRERLEAENAKLMRALAAGPARLRGMNDPRGAAHVEAAQRAAMEEK